MSPQAARERRLMVLDRDGTLIDVVRDEETGTVTTAFHPDQIRWLPGVLEGLRAAHRSGWLLAVATNQPGPAKGQCSAAAVQRTNDALISMLAHEGIPIAAIESCMHHPEGGPGGDASLVGTCECRKPKPGMIVALLQKLGVEASKTWAVGDTATDVEAARAAGVRVGLVFPAGRCELCPLRGGPAVVPDLHAPTFDALVAAILAAP
jgi:D-glycero-D-manno-heptose 1,7-bisphosphate phosphatase